MKKTYGYARVSTREQHLDRQIKALMDCGIDEREIITDKATGVTLERAGYQALKNTILREGDTLVIKSLDRLSAAKSTSCRSCGASRSGTSLCGLLTCPRLCFSYLRVRSGYST